MHDIDSCFYGEVINELENGFRIKEFWGEAIAKSKGNKDKAESLYVERRARSLEAFYNLQSDDSTKIHDKLEFLESNKSRTYG